MTKQMTKIAMMMVLAISLMANAATAQTKIGNKIGNDFSAAVIYTGLETSAGTLDPMSGFRYGNAFVLSGTDEYDSRYLTVSINSGDLGYGIGITGGMWSLVVIRDGVYLGTIYGEVMSGEIENITDKTGEIIGKRTRLELQAKGGTGNLDTDETLNLHGGFDMKTDLSSKETNAIAKFNF
jgi:hypothetical protein